MKYKYILISILILIILSSSFPKNNSCHISTYKPHFNPQLDLTNYQKQFEKDNIVLINNIFTKDFFSTLQYQILQKLYNDNDIMKRNNIFHTIRKAITVKASDLMKNDIIKNLYYSTHFIQLLSTISNLPLQNVSCNDEASANLLVYNQPDDFITWHTDPNHYVGKRLTILISILNTNKTSTDLSMSELQYIKNGEKISIKMPENSILIFNGSEIYHQATPIATGDNRIVLSFTYCDTCKESLSGYLFKSFKEMILGY